MILIPQYLSEAMQMHLTMSGRTTAETSIPEEPQRRGAPMIQGAASGQWGLVASEAPTGLEGNHVGPWFGFDLT